MTAPAKRRCPLAFWTISHSFGIAYIQTSEALTRSTARGRAHTIALSLSANFEDLEWKDIRVFRSPLLDEAPFWEKIERGEHGQRVYDIHNGDSEIDDILVRLGLARMEEDSGYKGMVYFSSPRAMAARDEWEANG